MSIPGEFVDCAITRVVGFDGLARTGGGGFCYGHRSGGEGLRAIVVVFLKCYATLRDSIWYHESEPVVTTDGTIYSSSFASLKKWMYAPPSPLYSLVKFTIMPK